MHRYFTTAMRHTYVAAVSLGGLLVSGSEGGDDLVCDAKFPSFVDNAEQASKAVSFSDPVRPSTILTTVCACALECGMRNADAQSPFLSLRSRHAERASMLLDR